jgi:hypothetical protein
MRTWRSPIYSFFKSDNVFDSLFSIIIVDCVTFSLALPGNARLQLEVYAAIKIPKTGRRLLIFDITLSGALEKRWCAIVRRAHAIMEPAVLSLLHLHTRAKSLCTILIKPILMPKSGTTRPLLLLCHVN